MANLTDPERRKRLIESEAAWSVAPLMALAAVVVIVIIYVFSYMPTDQPKTRVTETSPAAQAPAAR